MSNLPGITVQLGQGALGRTAPNGDGVAALIVSGQNQTGFSIGNPQQLFSVQDAINMGLTKTINEAAYSDIEAFYKQAGEGAELWVTLYSPATSLAAVCSNDPFSPLMRTIGAAHGRVRLVGINKQTPVDYTPVLASGIDSDVVAALGNLQAILASHAAQHRPVRAFITGLVWNYTTTGLINLRLRTENRCAVVLGALDSRGNAAIGLALGRAAAIPVHRNIGRVKDGPMTNIGMFVRQSVTATGLSSIDFQHEWNTLHQRGFLFLRSYQGKSGYYWNDDMMAAPATDDYSNLAHGRVIDKAHVIAYSTYVEELLDTVEIDSRGRIAASACKYFESRINNAVRTLMAGEISSMRSFVDPEQNVLSTGRLTVSLAIVPLGTLREIVVQLGFENPALS